MSIQPDDVNTGIDTEDAVSALMAQMTPPKNSPSNAEDTPAHEQADEEYEDDEDIVDEEEGEYEEDPSDDDEEGDEDDAETDEEEEAEEPAPAVVSDEAVVSVVVDGEEQQFTVGSLKRLAGQEASLTRKSQEAEQVGQRAAVVLTQALETLNEDLDAYKGVDWLLEGQRMDPEEFQWHRENYNKLQSRYQKIVSEAQNLDQTLSARQAKVQQERAAEAVKVLSDPENGIPGWSDKVYDDILSFAVKAGLDESEVNRIVDPNVIKIINKARLYDEAQTTAAKKVNMTPKQVRKAPGQEVPGNSASKRQKVLERKLKTGRANDDDAIALLTGRWGVKGR